MIPIRLVCSESLFYFAGFCNLHAPFFKYIGQLSKSNVWVLLYGCPICKRWQLNWWSTFDTIFSATLLLHLVPNLHLAFFQCQVFKNDTSVIKDFSAIFCTSGLVPSGLVSFCVLLHAGYYYYCKQDIIIIALRILLHAGYCCTKNIIPRRLLFILQTESHCRASNSHHLPGGDWLNGSDCKSFRGDSFIFLLCTILLLYCYVQLQIQA